MHGDRLGRVQQGFDGLSVGVVAEQGVGLGPECLPDSGSQPEQGVQRAAGGGPGTGQGGAGQQVGIGQCAQVHDLLADADPAAGIGAGAGRG